MFGLALKFTVQTICAAIVAGAGAFSAAYYAAANNTTPGVQGSEWYGVIGAAVIAAVGTLTNHETK